MSICGFCEYPFQPKPGYPHQKYCTKKCGSAAALHKRTNGQRHPLLASGTIGAAYEALVSTKFLLAGYEVFKAVSPNCSCDLIVSKDGKLSRVEVTAGHLSADEKITYPKNGHAPHRWDILAVVLPDLTIRLIYHIPTGFNSL